MSRKAGLFEVIALCHVRLHSPALERWRFLAAPYLPIRKYKRVKLTDRDTDLISETLDDEFGDENPYAAPLCVCNTDPPGLRSPS